MLKFSKIIHFFQIQKKYCERKEWIFKNIPFVEMNVYIVLMVKSEYVPA
jgi:hypothetical protein